MTDIYILYNCDTYADSVSRTKKDAILTSNVKSFKHHNTVILL